MVSAVYLSQNDLTLDLPQALSKMQSIAQCHKDSLALAFTSCVVDTPQAFLRQGSFHGQDRNDRGFSSQKPRSHQLHATSTPTRHAQEPRETDPDERSQ